MIERYVEWLQNSAQWIKDHAEEIVCSYDKTRRIVITLEPDSIPTTEIVHEVIHVTKEEKEWQPRETI